MKTTIELPDDLYRKAKAVTALRGQPVRDLVEEGLRRVVEARPAHGEKSLVELMAHAIGVVESGVPDLATNPKHMEGFGRDGGGDR